MSQKNILVLLAVFGVLLIAGASLLYNALSEDYLPDQLFTTPQQSADGSDTTGTTASGAAAPDFTVYDAQGNAVKLSDFVGKPVVVNFWASWCGPCKSEMPDFETAYQKYGNNVQFLMVNMTDGSQETVERASQFIQSVGYTFPVYFDSDGDAAMTYGVRSIPTTYFIDAQGNGVAWASGALDMQTLEKGIQMIITD